MRLTVLVLIQSIKVKLHQLTTVAPSLFHAMLVLQASVCVEPLCPSHPGGNLGDAWLLVMISDSTQRFLVPGDPGPLRFVYETQMGRWSNRGLRRA